MKRLAASAAVLLLCALSRPLLAEDGGAADGRQAADIPANTWVEAKLKFVLPADIPDASWSTTDGYSDATFRSKTGEVLWRTGVQSKAAGLSPGFYSNATLAWAPAAGEARVVTLSAHWGGGSYGGGKLLAGFKQNEEPTPRHTYDGFAYVADEDALYLELAANWRIGQKATDEAKKQLAIDNASTWKYSFADKKWTRIDDSIRRFWPGGEVSPYESHLQHWPAGGKLLFLDDKGTHYATFDLKTARWAKGELANKCPMSLYNARSTWDAKRGLWVFRLGPSLCTFDPARRTFAALPAPYPTPESKDDPRRACKGVTYIDKHDVYLIAGPTGSDTYACSPQTGKWTQVPGGDIKLINGYMQYDPASDLAVLVYQHHAYRFRYVPPPAPQD